MRCALCLLFLLLGLRVFAQQFAAYDQTIPGTPLKFKMVPIAAGSFTMGTAQSEKARDADEGPQRKVSVSAFWMAETEVTFSQWDAFFKNLEVPQTKNISVDAVSRPTAQYIDLTWGMGRDANHPSNSMSHQAALMYCKWLYEQTNVFFRLPTEAEWEYACLAGSSSGQPPLKLQAYFKENSDSKFHKVKELKPNAWGLYDMLGNLSEWTLDQYNPDAYSKLTDNALNPLTPPGARYPKVVRGGSYRDEAKEIRCRNRIASDASWNKRDPQVPKSKWWLTDGMFVGFRIVRPLQQPDEEEIEKFFAKYLTN